MGEKSTGKCLYKYETALPPCVVLRVFKYSYLKDFIADIKGKTSDLSVALKIDCIEFKGDHIDIKNDNCINCMFCVFGCPGNNIEVKDDFTLKAMCSNFIVDYDNKLGEDQLGKLFTGEFLKLPSIRLNQFKVKYKSFQDFTEKDETTNIAVWGANILRYLSQVSEPRLALEVGMIINTRDRGGRLDICMLNKDLLFVAEAKVSFDKMMNENRYVSQLLAYEEELQAATREIALTHYKFLLIGGQESDLLPQDHPNCTQKVGNRASTFYQTIIENKFYFISANALLSLALLKLTKGDSYSFENIYKKLFQENVLGLLSIGLVVNNNGNIEIKKL